MPWEKQNYNQTIETQTSRIRIVDLIAANVYAESEKLSYLKLQVFLWSLYSSISSPFTYNPGSCTAGSVHQSIQKERKPSH